MRDPKSTCLHKIKKKTRISRKKAQKEKKSYNKIKQNNYNTEKSQKKVHLPWSVPTTISSGHVWLRAGVVREWDVGTQPPYVEFGCHSMLFLPSYLYFIFQVQSPRKEMSWFLVKTVTN